MLFKPTRDGIEFGLSKNKTYVGTDVKEVVEGVLIYDNGRVLFLRRNGSLYVPDLVEKFSDTVQTKEQEKELDILFVFVKYYDETKLLEGDGVINTREVDEFLEGRVEGGDILSLGRDTSYPFTGDDNITAQRYKPTHGRFDYSKVKSGVDLVVAVDKVREEDMLFFGLTDNKELSMYDVDKGIFVAHGAGRDNDVDYTLIHKNILPVDILYKERTQERKNQFIIEVLSNSFMCSKSNLSLIVTGIEELNEVFIPMLRQYCDYNRGMNIPCKITLDGLKLGRRYVTDVKIETASSESMLEILEVIDTIIMDGDLPTSVHRYGRTNENRWVNLSKGIERLSYNTTFDSNVTVHNPVLEENGNLLVTFIREMTDLIYVEQADSETETETVDDPFQHVVDNEDKFYEVVTFSSTFESEGEFLHLGKDYKDNFYISFPDDTKLICHLINVNGDNKHTFAVITDEDNNVTIFDRIERVDTIPSVIGINGFTFSQLPDNDSTPDYGELYRRYNHIFNKIHKDMNR